MTSFYKMLFFLFLSKSSSPKQGLSLFCVCTASYTIHFCHSL